MCSEKDAADQCAAQQAASLDFLAQRKEYLFRLPQWASEVVVSNLKDSRDLPVATLYFNVICVAVPAVVLLYIAPGSHAYGAVYLISLYAVFLARFLVALLHVTEHRPLFRMGKSLIPLLQAMCSCCKIEHFWQQHSHQVGAHYYIQLRSCEMTLQAMHCSIL